MRGTLILFALAVALLLGVESKAQTLTTVTLGWNPTSTNTAVTGYMIYYGPDTNINDMTPVPVNPAQVTNVTIGGLVSGQTYYFAAASHDANFNLSSPSPEISVVAGSVAQVAAALKAVAGLPAGQFGFMLTGATSAQYVVQASTDLVHWVALQTNTGSFQFVDSNAAQFPHRFYRTVSTSN